jgi:hypothetical protein
MGVGIHKGGSLTLIKILDFEINNQNNTSTPFVIMEDDASMCRQFPNDLNIPNDTDILFIGIIMWV